LTKQTLTSVSGTATVCCTPEKARSNAVWNKVIPLPCEQTQHKADQQKPRQDASITWPYINACVYTYYLYIVAVYRHFLKWTV